jgi:hypothetical protein
MDIRRLHETLIAAARANPPGDAVPYAFEKRIAAQLRSLATEDPLKQWSLALWRAAAPCLGIMLLLGVWSFTEEEGGLADPDLSQQMEHAVLAEVEQEQVLDFTW